MPLEKPRLLTLPSDDLSHFEAGSTELIRDWITSARASTPIMFGVSLTPAERIVCAGLRGEIVVVTADVLDAARRHRVHWLLQDRQSVSFVEPAWAAGVKREVLHAAALDARRDEDTRALLDALSASGIDALVFKGAALAHLIYTAPHLRPRTDIDILIRAEDRDRAGGVLEASGWRRPPEPDLDESAAQRHYARQGPGRTAWLADVHWKVANPRVFGDAVSFDDIRSRAIPLPALGAAALTPGLCDALLLACMHRVAHHDDEVDLLWLWDVHLLVERIADRDIELFGHLARRAGMTAVCRSGIELSAALFGSRRALELLDQLRSSAYEPSARFVGGARRVTIFASDLGLAGNLAFALAPSDRTPLPARRLHAGAVPRCPAALVPVAYALRIARGAPKWLRPPRSTAGRESTSSHP